MAYNLLGMFQPQQSQMQTLLGEYYDPKAARMAWLGGALQAAGAGLASGRPGAWAEGLALGGSQGNENYRRRALVEYGIKNQQDQQAKEDKRYQTEWDWRVAQAEEARKRQAKADARDNTRFAWEVEDRDNPQANGPEYGLNPVWAKDANGNWMLFQPSKNGGAPSMVQFPEGVAPQPQVSFQDLGTSVQPMTTRGAVPMGAPLPKDVAGVEEQKALGSASGAATAAAPADIQAADNALALIDQIRTNPYLERGTGLSSYGNMIPGTGGYDFQNLVDQAKSGAFLSAIQQMRGMGSLSNAEGQTATAAVTRMNTATSTEAFMAALADYEKVIQQGKARAANRLGGQPQQAPTAPDLSGGQPNVRKYNPATGRIE